MCFCSKNVDFQGGFSIQGGSPSRGVLHQGGFSIQGGVLYPRGGSLSKGGFSIRGGPHPGGSPSRGVLHPGGVPCDLSHHAFDVTCMLPPHQLRLNTNAAPYILLAHCMLGYHPPPCEQNE